MKLLTYSPDKRSAPRLGAFLGADGVLDLPRAYGRAFHGQAPDWFGSVGALCSGLGGIILAMGNSRQQIQTIIEEDPFYQHGLADFRIVEFRASQRAHDIPKRLA